MRDASDALDVLRADPCGARLLSAFAPGDGVHLVGGAVRDLLLGRPWRELAGVLPAVIVVAALSLAVFGTDVFRLFHILSTQQQLVSGDSIPAQLTHFVGLAGVTPLVRTLLHAFELGAIAWLLCWYTLWPLPFAALSSDRRLRFATLSLFGYFVAQRWTILLGQG